MSYASNAARRYARALHEQARAQDAVPAVDDDMETLHATLEASDDLVRFFQSPIISQERKHGVVRALFDERLHELSSGLLRLLVEKKREGLVQEIVQAYRALRDAEEGRVEAQAQVAHDLDKAGRDQLQAALEGLLGKQVRLTVEQNPDLIGGVVVRIGDTVYDRSVRRQLDALRSRLERGQTAVESNGGT